jgi:hypothetical protein
MSNSWIKNIHNCRSIIRSNLGPRVVNVVSGSPADQTYWLESLKMTRQEIFRMDAETTIISSMEAMRKGNFLGSVNAWMEVKKAMGESPLPPIMLMNMVFGLGKRFSPFTQALGNRKPAFPTPLRTANLEAYLTMADVAAMSATLWQHHLESNGFNGIIIKWGDEAIVPGRIWESGMSKYKNVDGIRFIWQTEPTEELAREKEWVEFDTQTLIMTHQYTRQGLDSLRMRLSERGENRQVGVNLGSLGISYPLMQAAEEIFREDVLDENKWVDWDPYTWIALTCRDESEWKAEAALEDRMGKTGMVDLANRMPDFFYKIQQVRNIFQMRHGRMPVIAVLDFGQPYWMDWGLHLSLIRSLEALVTDSDLGTTSRELFQLPQERDQNGNLVVRSMIPKGADIRNSILVDTVVTDPETVILGGLVVAGRHRKLQMPYGGCALFCAADDMKFNGAHAIAFKSTGNRFQLGEGDRLTTLQLLDGAITMQVNESLINFEGENYTLPVLGNPISFEEAGRRMSGIDTRLVEKRWFDQWNNWLG